jgi:hypothetical protein
MVPMVAIVTGAIPARIRGGFMSVNQSIQALSSGTAVYVSGLMIEKMPSGQIEGYRNVGYLAALFTLGAIAAAWKVSNGNEEA